VSPQQPADVLDHPPLPGEGKGEEERVQGRPIEPFAEVRRGRHEDDTALAVLAADVPHGGSSLLAKAPSEHERGYSASGESPHEAVDLVGPLGEYETLPPLGQSRANVSAHHGVAFLVLSAIPRNTS
jgi:hypothetical protein